MANQRDLAAEQEKAPPLQRVRKLPRQACEAERLGISNVELKPNAQSAPGVAFEPRFDPFERAEDRLGKERRKELRAEDFDLGCREGSSPLFLGQNGVQPRPFFRRERKSGSSPRVSLEWPRSSQANFSGATRCDRENEVFVLQAALRDAQHESGGAMVAESLREIEARVSSCAQNGSASDQAGETTGIRLLLRLRLRRRLLPLPLPLPLLRPERCQAPLGERKRAQAGEFVGLFGSRVVGARLVGEAVALGHSAEHVPVEGRRL